MSIEKELSYQEFVSNDISSLKNICENTHLLIPNPQQIAIHNYNHHELDEGKRRYNYLQVVQNQACLFRN